MLSTCHPMHREAIYELFKSIGLWLATASSAVGTFIVHALPLAQLALCVVGIISGYYSIKASRAACEIHRNQKPKKDQ